jgi:hypothetical protein
MSVVATPDDGFVADVIPIRSQALDIGSCFTSGRDDLDQKPGTISCQPSALRALRGQP